MANSSKSNSNKKDNKSAGNKADGKPADPIKLTQNADYLNLLECYQRGDFKICEKLLKQVESQYPSHPLLVKFKEDLDMKLSLKHIETTIKKDAKKKKKIAVRNLTVFGIIATAIIVIVFLAAYLILSGSIMKRQQADETSLLSSLNYQAEQLLQAGQPQPAAQIIEQMKTINPAYETLAELTEQVTDLLRLEANYQQAISLIAENKNREALTILNDINGERPGLWDVCQQITYVENTFKIEEYMAEGNNAFMAGDWAGVVSAYENALSLDPKLDDPLMKEQLLQGYLNRIINMLDSKEATIEDIELAEDYYRKAVAMAPQSKAFASERGNLQDASSNLLEVKFTQMAKANLSDKNQTLTSIAEAVSFMRKAANIQPGNSALNTDLKNAEYYQIAFKNFMEMNWEKTISNLSQISSSDANYAGGNASVLLFEAYYALGKQYASVGLYLDAVTRLEQAEILAWNDTDNLMKLFQVQILLGETIGKLKDYENAVSYYQYALNAIEVNRRLTKFPDISRNLSQATVLMSYNNFQEALEYYQAVVRDIEVIYSISEIEIADGACLAFFASENLSTIDAIIEANNLPKSMAITYGRNLQVPIIEE